MSDDYFLAEYAAPESVEPVQAPLSRTTLNVIAVVCIVLGGLGTMSGLTSLSQTLFGARMQRFMSPPQAGPGGNAAEMQKIQEQLQGEILAIVQRYYFYNLVLGFAHVTLALFLLIGGIRIVSNKPNSLSMLRNTCLVAIGFELARCVLQAMVQMEIIPVQVDFMERIADLSGEDLPVETMQTGVRIGMYVVIGLMIAWTVAKVAFYAIAAWCLGTRHRADTGASG